MKQTKKKQIVLSLNQLHKLLDTAKGQSEALIMTASLVGLRLGELLALRWRNLDWDKGTLQVKESFSSFGLDTPKTKTSTRAADLPPKLIEILRKHKKVWQNEMRLAAGDRWQEKDLIFTSLTGNHLDQGNVRRLFSKLMNETNQAIEKENEVLKEKGKPEIPLLPRVRFHDLRAVACTLMLESGASLKHVMDQLGHSTPAMTLGIYAGVTQEAKRQAQEKLDKYVFG